MAKASKPRKKYNARMQFEALVRTTFTNCIVTSVVDVDELLEKDGSKYTARTCIYNRRKQTEERLTRTIAMGLKQHRHQWDVHTAILCRDEQNKYYFSHEYGFRCETPVLLEELNDHLADTMVDNFQSCGGDALTMVWVASPNDLGNISLEDVLYPLWRYNVLQHLCTLSEQSSNTAQFLAPSFSHFSDYAEWFTKQDEYIQQHKENTHV